MCNPFQPEGDHVHLERDMVLRILSFSVDGSSA